MSAANSHLKQSIVKALDLQPDILLAILFGSVAAGQERAESDIDVAIDVGRILTPHEKMTLIANLGETTGRPVDLVDLHIVGEPLLGQILRHGERILGTAVRHAELTRKHLLDEADFLPYRERILRERRQAWIGT